MISLINDPLSFHKKTYFLKDHSTVRCFGGDCVRFFNGQLTNDASQLKNNEFQGQVRLDRSGKAQFFFYLLKSVDDFYIIIEKDQCSDLISDLDKYIIMDDVTFETQDVVPQLLFHYEGNSFYASLPCDLTLEKVDGHSELSHEEFYELSLMGGAPIWNKTILKDQLVTDSVAMLDCVSLKKGCFLGQETVAKIESRRGGAYFPVALKKLDDKKLTSLSIGGKVVSKVIDSVENFDIVFLKRDERVQEKVLVFDNGEKRSVHYLPLWKKLEVDERAIALYEKGAELFQQNEEDLAIKYMNEAINIKPDFADAYESLGVILGRHEKYDEAIKLMDQLGEVDPESVMAHTNKSLYLMKLGKIEEAEEEKAQATMKTFAMYGKEAQSKKAKEEKEKEEEAELARRENMFRQVLELDPEDALAGYGLADIEYYRKNYERSIELLEKVLISNPKYSVAYLLLGKCLVATKSENSKEVLVKGIDIASKNGDLMPANSMQEILNRLS